MSEEVSKFAKGIKCRDALLGEHGRPQTWDFQRPLLQQLSVPFVALWHTLIENSYSALASRFDRSVKVVYLDGEKRHQR